MNLLMKYSCPLAVTLVGCHRRYYGVIGSCHHTLGHLKEPLLHAALCGLVSLRASFHQEVMFTEPCKQALLPGVVSVLLEYLGQLAHKDASV